MNELLKPDEIQRLVGQELTSVCVSTNTVSLQLVKYPISVGTGGVDEANILIETGFELQTTSNLLFAKQNDNQRAFRIAGSQLVSLIERTVVEAFQCTNGVLVLRFDENTELRLLVSEEGWESYQIFLKGCGPAYYTAIFGNPK